MPVLSARERNSDIVFVLFCFLATSLFSENFRSDRAASLAECSDELLRGYRKRARQQRYERQVRVELSAHRGRAEEREPVYEGQVSRSERQERVGFEGVEEHDRVRAFVTRRAFREKRCSDRIMPRTRRSVTWI